MLLAFALFGKARNINRLVLAQLEDDNGLGLFDAISDYGELDGNDGLLMVDGALDESKIISGHLSGISLFILDFQLEFNSAKVTNVNLVIAVALVGKVEHVNTLAVERYEAQSVGDLLVLKSRCVLFDGDEFDRHGGDLRHDYSSEGIDIGQGDLDESKSDRPFSQFLEDDLGGGSHYKILCFIILANLDLDLSDFKLLSFNVIMQNGYDFKAIPKPLKVSKESQVRVY